MTTALVVHESLFGDGRTIARAIADGLSARMTVTVAAAQDAGHPANPDFNGPQQEGVGIYQLTQRDGRRWR